MWRWGRWAEEETDGRLASSKGRWLRTHGGEETSGDDADAGREQTDILRGLRGQTAQGWTPFYGFRGYPHDDALVLRKARWFFAGFSSLVQDRSQLIALVTAFGKESGKIRCRKVPVAEVFEEFPYL